MLGLAVGSANDEVTWLRIAVLALVVTGVGQYIAETVWARRVRTDVVDQPASGTNS